MQTTMIFHIYDTRYALVACNSLPHVHIRYCDRCYGGGDPGTGKTVDMSCLAELKLAAGVLLRDLGMNEVGGFPEASVAIHFL